MVQFVGRFVLLSVLFSLVLLVIGFFVAQNSDIQLRRFGLAQESRFVNARPVDPPIDEIMVTPCAAGACLLVQAGGREFVVGASANSADGLMLHGLLSDRLDGVLLYELSTEHLEGLIGLRDHSLEVGRKEKLKVYGASGVEVIIDGMNAMLETSDVDRSVRYGAGILPFDLAPAEAVTSAEIPGESLIFDSGVLQIHAFPIEASVSGAELIYRFDYEGQSLLVGGCAARLPDVITALKGGQSQSLLVLPSASAQQLKLIQEKAQIVGLRRESRFATAPAEKCLSPAGLKSIAQQAGIGHVLATPIYPAPVSKSDVKLWQNEISQTEGVSVLIDLSIGEPWTGVSVKQTP